MSNKEIAERHEILRGLVGSTAHGTGLDGHEDRDEMGIFIEPAANVCGMTSLDHVIWRSQPDGVRSGPGDLDLTLYSLRKFCRLATHGNPSVLVLLWLPDYLKLSPLGQRLLDIRDAFVSKEAGERFLGYLLSQKAALKGERNKKVIRPELVERFGFDTKFAMHALRLGLQGIEYLTDGRITMPVPEPQRAILRGVRQGNVTLSGALTLIEDAEQRLRCVVNKTSAKADRERVDRFLVEAHREAWATP